MKKALIVSSVASMIEQFNMPNIRLLLSMDYEVHVASNFKNSGNLSTIRSDEFILELEQIGVKIHQVDFPRNPFNIKKLRAAFARVKEILDLNFSIVHSHSPVGGVVARLSAKKYRKKGLKSIYTAHGFHFMKGSSFINWLVYYPIEYILSNYTDVLITINQEDFTLAKKRFKAKKIIYLQGVGIDIDYFVKPSLEEKNELRNHYGFTPDDFIMIFIAELNNNKNQIMLINAVESLIQIESKIKLVLVGNGPHQEKYEELIKIKKLDQNIKILGYRTDIKQLLAISDVSVSASIREGLPVNIQEAMATGLPIVASNCRGNVDLVRHEQNGFLYPVNNETDFTNSVLQLLSNKNLRTEMSENSVILSVQYSKSKIMDEFHKLY